MTPRRIVFEWIHKLLGYALILLAIVTAFIGLWQANAPRRFFILIVGWWVFLAIATVYLQKCGMALDTYQAIRGPSPAHPGNRRSRPIGFGVKMKR